MEDIIKNILEQAVNAPSGENVQPWRFKIQENKISVFNIPERDQSPYNFLQRGSFISHGALIENISIISSTLGFTSSIDLFPEKDNPHLVAIISLNKSLPQNESLYPYIIQRATNRKPYHKKSLTRDQCGEILQAISMIDGTRALLTEKEDNIKELSLVGAMNERLVLENKVVHDFLFSHINWNEEENNKKKIGFYIKTLELPPPAQLMFKVFRNWTILKKINKIGISKGVWKQNAGVYSTASAIGVIYTENNSNEDFIRIGRATQRLWLTVTKLGLSLQPMTGTLFFKQRILAGNNEPFEPYQIDLINESYEKVCAIFDLKNKNIPMMFRIGYSDLPSARAIKLKPEIIS